MFLYNIIQGSNYVIIVFKNYRISIVDVYNFE